MITLPVLVMTETEADYRRFVRESNILLTETKRIGNVEDIHGYVNKTLLIVSYPKDSNGILAYADQHNIKKVRANR